MSGPCFMNNNQGEHVHVHCSAFEVGGGGGLIMYNSTIRNKQHCRTAGSEASTEEKLRVKYLNAR